MSSWILTGDARNWKEALESRGIWGVRANLKERWSLIESGDEVFFYCKSPISAIVGFGRVRAKFRQSKPFWPDEVATETVIYPFRFEFDIDFLLTEDRWATQGAKAAALGLQRNHVSAGMNQVKDRSLVERIQKALGAPRKEELRTRELNHSNVQKMLLELGRLQRFVSESEYPMDGERLDVVWRRIEKSSPTYVFEVQVGGDVQHALGKLKHAYDLWNSEIFLALGDKDAPKASILLSGTFHEIHDRVKVLKLEDVRRLYELKKDWKEYEERLGIL